MKETLREGVDIEKILQPETDLEKTILKSSEFRKGLFWGKPRYGHPEGEVLYHVREVLDNIDKLNADQDTRYRLRLIALAHDTFKISEEKGVFPRDWSKHHSVYARKFMEHYTDDQGVLDVIELHDEVYYCWRSKVLYNQVEEGEARFERFKSRIGDNLQLFYLFFKCDTKTGDKTLSPLYWFEKNMTDIEIVDF